MTDLRAICVFAGSRPGARPDYAAAARELGAGLAERGIDMVFGGGSVGLMGVCADAVLAGGGRVIGVIPAELVRREVAHEGVTEMHVVETMHERKALMERLSDAVIALPGGLGTFDELFEILTWGQLGIHGMPSGLLNVAGYFDAFLALTEHVAREGFTDERSLRQLIAAQEAGELLARLAAYEPPDVERWVRRDGVPRP